MFNTYIIYIWAGVILIILTMTSQKYIKILIKMKNIQYFIKKLKNFNDRI
jgi:hypothetical protein